MGVRKQERTGKYLSCKRKGCYHNHGYGIKVYYAAPSRVKYDEANGGGYCCHECSKIARQNLHLCANPYCHTGPNDTIGKARGKDTYCSLPCANDALSMRRAQEKQHASTTGN